MPNRQEEDGSEQTAQQQKERKLIQPELILTIPLEKMRPSMPKDVHPITSIDLHEARQKKTAQILTAAYETVRIGGTLGTTYELSTKHIPHAPTDFFQGKPLKADCDEMILAMIATAKAYGVKMQDISVLDFDITAKFAGGATQLSMGHAVAVTLNEGMLLFDPAFGFNGIHIKDKKPETLDGIYHGKNVLDGSYVVVGVDIAKEPVELIGDKQIASLYYHDLGVYHQINGKDIAAAGAFETAYKLNQNDEDKRLSISTYGSLNDKANRKKEYGLSEVYLRKIISLDPNVAAYHAELANTIIKMDKMKEALAEFDKALLLEPTNGTVYAQKASALEKIGRKNEAINILESAMQTGIKTRDIYVELTFLYNGTGEKKNLERTLEICTEWRMIVPGDIEIFLKESFAYFELARGSLEKEKTEKGSKFEETLRLLHLSVERANFGLDKVTAGSEFNALRATKIQAESAINTLELLNKGY